VLERRAGQGPWAEVPHDDQQPYPGVQWGEGSLSAAAQALAEEALREPERDFFDEPYGTHPGEEEHEDSGPEVLTRIPGSPR
jgi:hypothetical protein